MKTVFEHGYALIIGVGECLYTNWSLPATVKDAEAVQRALLDAGLCAYDKKNLRLLKDKSAARKEILDGLAWLKTCAQNDPESTIFLFYSGHGWVDQGSGNYYLIPSDTSPLRPAKTALAAADLTEALRAIPAQRLLVILDSCHAAGMATSKDAALEEESLLPENFQPAALPKSISSQLAQGQGRAVFTSSSGDEPSWVRSDGSMSIYTFHLIEALEGAGNREGDTLVRLSNLMNHVAKAVPQSVRQECGSEQTPNFDFKTEDFPVALLRGGKGLPKGGWGEVVRQTQTAASTQGVQASGERSVAIGQKASGNTIITGDHNIQVGDISNASGIAIGHGASSTTVNTGGGDYYGSVQVQGGDFVGRDKITPQGAPPEDMAAAFALLYKTVAEQYEKSERELIDFILQKLEAQAQMGEQAEETEVKTLFDRLKAMAPDIFEVAVETFSNPLKGISSVIRKIIQKARQEKA